MVLVVGGGISGLSAAYYAVSRHPGTAVTLVEASSRLGGWVHSSRRPDGTVFEHGPRTIRPAGENGANTLNLIEELGLADKVHPITRNHPAAKLRLVFAKGALHKLPSSLGSLLTPHTLFSRPLAMALLTDLRAPRKLCTDESSYDFIARRLGHEVAEYAVSPLLCGVCAGDAHEISVKMLFRALFEAEQKHNSICVGLIKTLIGNIFCPSKKSFALGDLAKKAQVEKWSVYSLENGLQTIPEAIVDQLNYYKAEVIMNDRCKNIKFLSNGDVEIKLQSGRVLKSDHIVCSLPAANLALLVIEQHPELGKMLLSQKYATVGVVNLQYRGNVLKQPAFGFLAPPSEQLPLLGVIFDSVCFPNTNGDTVLTAMMGGHWFHPQFSSATHEELVRIAKECIAKILDITDEPFTYKVTIQEDCIPQYTVGHYEKVNGILEYIKRNDLPISLTGSSYDGIGLNDVIMSASKAISTIVKSK